MVHVFYSSLGAALLLYIAAVFCHAKQWVRGVQTLTDQRTDLRSVFLSLRPLRRRRTTTAAHVTAAAPRAGHTKPVGVSKRKPPM